MSDPIGTAGATKAQSDLEFAVGGGRRFADRLQQLADAADRYDEAKAGYEKALNNLQLGQAAANALRTAQDKHTEADRVLTEAQRRAAEIEQRGTQAALLIDKRATEEAAAKVAETQKRAATLTGEAEALMATATKAKAEVESGLTVIKARAESLDQDRLKHQTAVQETAAQHEHAQHMLARLVEIRDNLDRALRDMG